MKVKEFIKADHGTIYFGKKFNGFKWNDKRVTKDWLEWVLTDECLTTAENKNKAKKELLNRPILVVPIFLSG